MKTTLTGIAEQNTADSASETALVPQGSAALTQDGFFSNAELEGDFDRSDFKTPKLHLTQSVGPLSATFQPGNWIYNKDTDLGNRPLEVTALKLRKYFVQDIAYGSEVFPDICSSEKEFMAKGGLPIREKYAMEKQAKGSAAGKLFYKPTLDITCLIAGRKEDVLPFEFEGVPYALAVWTLSSTGYSKTGTTFISAAALGLRSGLAWGRWTVTPKREKVGQNWIWLPIARQTAKNSQAFVDFARDLSGGVTK